MTLRQWFKYQIYGLAGTFPYFGVRVHFPRRSVAFLAACEQGIFEADNVRILQELCRHGSYMFDVGANLGLMAIPVLHAVDDCKVISFEPSPNSLPWLKKTIVESKYSDRWVLVDKAAGDKSGRAKFSVSPPTDGLYDGFKSTGRVPEIGTVDVEVTTLDAVWKSLGRPPISIIKIDVEGCELNVLSGASECLEKMHPFVLLEWNKTNMNAYGLESSELLEFSRIHKYVVYSISTFVPINSSVELQLHQLRAESFLLVPG